MHKQYISLLTVLLLFSLAACGSDGSDSVEIDSSSALTDSTVSVAADANEATDTGVGESDAADTDADTDTINSDTPVLVPVEADTDSDGTPNATDNCPAVSNVG